MKENTTPALTVEEFDAKWEGKTTFTPEEWTEYQSDLTARCVTEFDALYTSIMGPDA